MESDESNAKSTLYIAVNQCGHLPASSWSVVFLHQFCVCNTYNVVQVDIQETCNQQFCNWDQSSSNGLMSLPQSLVSSSSVKSWSELPEIVKSCDLPAIVDAKELVCYTGLCTVLRRLVKSADEQDTSRNLISLLGFRQTSLKTCSEVSPWTKLCEVQAPVDIAALLQGGCNEDTVVTKVPEAVHSLETSLSEPVTTTFNAVYRQQKLKKSSLVNYENTTTEQECGDNKRTNLKAAYKSAAIITDKRKYKQWIHGGKPEDANQSAQFSKDGLSMQDQSDLCIPFSQLNTSKDTKVSAKAASHPKSITSSTNEMTGTSNVDSEAMGNAHGESDLVQGHNPDNAPMCNEGETAQEKNETSSTKQKKKSKTKKHQYSLPTLERTFAEGPDLTLTDVALFPYIHFFVAYANEIGCTDVLRTIPFVLGWCGNMWDVPNILDTSVECGLKTARRLNDLVCDESVSHTKKDKEQTTQEADFGKGKSRKAVKAAIKRELPGILEKLQRGALEVKFEEKLVNTQLDWDSFPTEVNPCQDVDEKRARNKRSQVESLVAGVKMLAKKPCKIVDFCSGGGHVGIVLAYLLPECHVVMIENNEESLRRAVERVASLDLRNVTLYQSNIDYFIGKFDIGVSLHACGVATDLVLSKCQQHQAAFVSSPCCYGGLLDTHLITYPRSQRYKAAGITSDELFIVGHAAEQTSWNFESEHSKRGKLCMGFIDRDRASAAEEHGYHVILCSLQPFTCSPKNNLLIGWHKGNEGLEA